MSTRESLIEALADGELHSGSLLAARLGLSRSAVWKQLHRLDALGLEVVSVAGRGYRLSEPLDLLRREQILAALDGAVLQGCESLEVAAVIGSTSAALMAGPAPRPGHWCCLLAEHQTAGRGRRGRRWLSPYAGGLCLSLGWSFASPPRDLPALSLAAGIAVRRALAALGVADARLKWPNDVLLDGAKLAGILVDVDGDARGPLRAVIGLGLNLSAPAAMAQAIVAEGGVAPARLDVTALAGRGGRNVLAAALIGALHAMLAGFAEQGFAPLAAEWERYDQLRGQPVAVTGAAMRIAGIARGIAADGALLVEGPGGAITPIYAGDVSLRGAG